MLGPLSLLAVSSSLLSIASASYAAASPDTTPSHTKLKHTPSSGSCTKTVTHWMTISNPTVTPTVPWTYIVETPSWGPSGSGSVPSGSGGLPAPSGAGNGTYHSPEPSTGSASKTEEAPPTTSSPSATKSGEPVFTAGAGLSSRGLDGQVWGWNLGIGAVLGGMAMFL